MFLLLFVLFMHPLSRKINATYPKVDIKTDTKQYITNHLLFIDDLKLYSEKEEILKKISEETGNIFKVVGLKQNQLQNVKAVRMMQFLSVPMKGMNT